jgi:PTH1 family peptidyl-tRNA hydrolase
MRLGPGFTRLKVGISRPPAGWEAERWVLARFSEEERGLLDAVLDAAVVGVETMLAEGLAVAMGATNGLDLAVAAGSAEVP